METFREPGGSFFATPLSFLHERELKCSACGSTSIHNGRGNIHFAPFDGLDKRQNQDVADE